MIVEMIARWETYEQTSYTMSCFRHLCDQSGTRFGDAGFITLTKTQWHQTDTWATKAAVHRYNELGRMTDHLRALVQAASKAGEFR